MMRKLHLWRFLGHSILVGAFVSGAAARDAAACLECHGDPGWLEDEETKRLHVDFEGFESSVHGFPECVDCHADLAGADPWGHDPELEDVDCSVCHPDVRNLP